MKLLTVGIPVYNGMPYLPAAVESVLAQTYTNFDLIIIDDGSTDDSSRYLASLSDSRVKIYHQPNCGLGFSLNRLCKLATTKYIARMDADDICHIDRLRQQIEYLELHDDVVMVGAGIEFLVDDLTVQKTQVVMNHAKIHSALLQGRFPICHPTIIFRKNVAIMAGGYRIVGAGEDLDFFLRMAEFGQLANISNVLLSYRLHDGSLSLNKQHELNKAYAYAVDCALRRRKNIEELSFDNFSNEIWQKRSRYQRFISEMYVVSERLYRKSIVSRARGQFFGYWLRIGLAACMRPKAVVDKGMNLLRLAFR